MIERENLESNYESLLTTHKDYKAKTAEELTNLRKLPSQVSELEKKLHKAELDLEGYRLKDAPADQEAVAKVRNEMRRLTQKTAHIAVTPPVFPLSTAGEDSSNSSPNKRRTDGRRVGVIVKDGRDGKSSPAKVDPVTGTIGMKTPTSAKRRQSVVKPFSPKGLALADGEGKSISDPGQQQEQQKLSESVSQAGQEEEDEVTEATDDGEDIELLSKEENEKSKRKVSVPRRASIRSVQSSRRSSGAGATSKEAKGQPSKASSQERKASLKKLPSKRKISQDLSAGSSSSSSSSAIASAAASGDSASHPFDPTTSSTAAGDASAPTALVQNNSVRRSEDDKREKTGSVGEEESDDEDDFDEIAAPPRVLMKTSSMSQRRMTKLASLEDPILPSTENLLGKAVDTLVEDEESANEVGIDENMKKGLLRSLSQMSRSLSGDPLSASSRVGSEDQEDGDGQGQVQEEEEEEEEEDEIEEEMSSDVAKTWGQLTKALNNVLSENLGEDIANKASHVIAPVTIEFCSILSKCTMVSDVCSVLCCCVAVYLLLIFC
jgi:hypothetical protein